MNPLILLDVDGVLNPDFFSPGLSPDWKFETFIFSALSGSFRLNLSKEMGEAIAGLGGEIRWLTTWGDHAHPNIGQVFGWPEYPVAGRPRGFSDTGWKPAAVAEAMRKHPGPIVWIENDSTDYYENYLCHHFGLPFFERPDRLIIVAPDPRVGLTRAHLDYIRERLKEP